MEALSMQQRNVRPCLEELEGRAVPSAARLAAPALAQIVIDPPLPPILAPLSGQFAGSYTVAPGIPDLGTHYDLTGKGTVGLLGPVNLTGFAQGTGMIPTGRAFGSLTLSNGPASVTLKLTADPQPGFAKLPVYFHFSVSGGTGAYQNVHAVGTVGLHLGANGHFTLWISQWVHPLPVPL
jgi:hypothetical protein